MLHLVGRLISIKYAAICNRENIAKFLIYEKRAVLSTPLFSSAQHKSPTCEWGLPPYSEQHPSAHDF